MFDEDVEYATAIGFVFDDTSLPSIGDELRSQHGATVAPGTCAECNGTLYECEYEVVCGNCSVVVGSDTETESTSRWAQFENDRPHYHNSKRARCVGGFPDTYDWVKSEDIDHPVRQLDPNKFYNG